MAKRITEARLDRDSKYSEPTLLVLHGQMTAKAHPKPLPGLYIQVSPGL